MRGLGLTREAELTIVPSDDVPPADRILGSGGDKFTNPDTDKDRDFVFRCGNSGEVKSSVCVDSVYSNP